MPSSVLPDSSCSLLHRPGVRLAEGCFREAIDANPLHSESWNGLGVVSRDPLVRQHCWVRAVQLSHNPSAWGNLGMLYLRWGLDNQVCGKQLQCRARAHPGRWMIGRRF